jgi:E3 ubiquitin-protein ligase NEDD4
MSAPLQSRLPQGWEEKRAPDGRTYYVDHSTHSTHWTLPAASPRLSQNLTQSQQHAPVQQQQYQQQHQQQQQVSHQYQQQQQPMNVPVQQQQYQQQIPQQQQHQSFPQQQVHAAPLPPGWEEKVAPDGRKYYINHQDRSTHWTRPC